MPDILEIRIRQDDLALAMFDYFKKKEKVRYADFMEEFENDPSLKMLLHFELVQLENAKLIKMGYSAKEKTDTITITEKGKNFEYHLK